MELTPQHAMTGELRGVQFIYTHYNSSLVYKYSNTSQQFQIPRKGTHTTFLSNNSMSLGSSGTSQFVYKLYH